MSRRIRSGWSPGSRATSLQAATGEVKAITEGAMHIAAALLRAGGAVPAIHRMRFILSFGIHGPAGQRAAGCTPGDLVTPSRRPLALKVHGKGAKNR